LRRCNRSEFSAPGRPTAIGFIAILKEGGLFSPVVQTPIANLDNAQNETIIEAVTIREVLAPEHGVARDSGHVEACRCHFEVVDLDENRIDYKLAIGTSHSYRAVI